MTDSKSSGADVSRFKLMSSQIFVFVALIFIKESQVFQSDDLLRIICLMMIMIVESRIPGSKFLENLFQ